VRGGGTPLPLSPWTGAKAGGDYPDPERGSGGDRLAVAIVPGGVLPVATRVRPERERSK
jgi:hypothetical protein